MSKLPERVTAMLVVSYDVADIASEVSLSNNIDKSEVTLEDVMDILETWASEDLSHARNRIIYQDENGNEIND